MTGEPLQMSQRRENQLPLLGLMSRQCRRRQDELCLGDLGRDRSNVDRFGNRGEKEPGVVTAWKPVGGYPPGQKDEVRRIDLECNFLVQFAHGGHRIGVLALPIGLIDQAARENPGFTEKPARRAFDHQNREWFLAGEKNDRGRWLGDDGGQTLGDDELAALELSKPTPDAERLANAKGIVGARPENGTHLTYRFCSLFASFAFFFALECRWGKEQVGVVTAAQRL